jgi:glutathione-regulated potassium-efflux system ancillary protein KefF
MSKTVIIIGHPSYDRSLANKTIIDNLPVHKNIEIRNLISLYPDYKIDVKKEQDALLRADLIVLQFPFYWYNLPAILKLWIDEVFSYGFAYGSTGDKLKGKKLLLSFTIGGPQESYSKEGYNHFKIEELITPHVQTASLSGMEFLKPIHTHGMIYVPGVYNKKEDVEAKAIDHSKRLYETIHKMK